MKKILILTTILLLSTLNLSAQGRRGGNKNTIGLKVGATLFDIKTDNFITTPKYSFVGGFSSRGDFYNNWDVQFGLNLFGTKLSVQGRENNFGPHDVGAGVGSTITDIDYSLLGVQAQLLFGYKLLGNNRNHKGKFKLTAEFGPVLMVNGKLKLADGAQKDFLIEKTDLTAEQIVNLTGVNINALAGLSMGTKHFRVFAHYQYGLNNILNRLKSIEGTTQKFKGNATMIQFGVFLYL
jgi:hypothetical protein